MLSGVYSRIGGPRSVDNPGKLVADRRRAAQDELHSDRLLPRPERPSGRGIPAATISVVERQDRRQNRARRFGRVLDGRASHEGDGSNELTRGHARRSFYRFGHP